MKTVVVYKTGEFDDARRSFETVIHIARKKCEANSARLTKPTLACKSLYASLHPLKSEAFIRDEDSWSCLYRGQPKQAVPPTRISVPLDDCPGNWPG